jgi:Aspartyl protease
MPMTRSLKRKLTIRVGLSLCLAGCLLRIAFANAADGEGSVDFRIVSGSEAVVPVSIEAGEVIVDVTINGRGPFPLMFDTGAQDAVTPETAAALDLKTEGSGTVRDSGGGSVPVAFARVATLRLGDTEMTDQPLAVFPLPRYLTDHGNRARLAGFVGYEVLARFVARLDYDRKTLTLTPARDFRYEGQGTRVPLTLTAKTPVILAAADGISGMFVVDTGSVGALTLRRSTPAPRPSATVCGSRANGSRSARKAGWIRQGLPYPPRASAGSGRGPAR